MHAGLLRSGAEQPVRAQPAQALLAQLRLVLGALGRRHALAADRQPRALGARSRRRVTVCLVSSRRTSSARGTSAPAGSQIETSSPTASVSSVSLRRIPLASRSLGITIRCSESVRRTVKFSRTSSTTP